MYDPQLMEENLLAFRWLCRIASNAGNKAHFLDAGVISYQKQCKTQWPEFKFYWIAYCYKANLAVNETVCHPGTRSL